jgi:hypothetical protein
MTPRPLSPPIPLVTAYDHTGAEITTAVWLLNRALDIGDDATHSPRTMVTPKRLATLKGEHDCAEAATAWLARVVGVRA